MDFCGPAVRIHLVQVQVASLLNNDHLTEWPELPSGVSFAQQCARWANHYNPQCVNMAIASSCREMKGLSCKYALSFPSQKPAEDTKVQIKLQTFKFTLTGLNVHLYCMQRFLVCWHWLSQVLQLLLQLT